MKGSAPTCHVDITTDSGRTVQQPMSEKTACRDCGHCVSVMRDPCMCEVSGKHIGNRKLERPGNCPDFCWLDIEGELVHVEWI